MGLVALAALGFFGVGCGLGGNTALFCGNGFGGLAFGNGAAMRCSPAGMIASSLEEAEDLGQRTAEVTHNHPEGIKTAAASMARQADRQRPTTSVRIL